jgi:hypothetical protein
MTLPFRSVTSADEVLWATHLVVISPALAGHRPDRLPAFTLCGRRVTAAADVHIAEVDCPGCLYTVPMFMALPGFEVHA